MQVHPVPRDADCRTPDEGAGAAPPAVRDAPARLPVWLLTALGLLLRLLGVGEQALWFDEVNTLWRVAAGSLGGVLGRIAGDVQAPLYDLLMWGWTRGGLLTDAAWVRLPSVLCSAALIPVTARLAHELGLRRRTQAVAAALVALAPFQVRFAQEARPYALLALLSGLALLAAVRVAASGGRRGLVLLAATGPLLVLVHYYGVLAWLAVVAALLLDAAACGARLPRMVGACLPALVALLAWSPVALRQFRLKEMNAVYRPLDAAALVELLDAQGVHAALTLPSVPLAEALGSAAALAPAAVATGRVLLALLVAAGAWGCWRVTRRPAPAGVVACRGPALALVALAALLAGSALLLPPELPERAAAALFKGGRALDAENRAALQALRDGVPRVAGLLVAAALLVGLALPAWVRRGRWRLPGGAWPVLAVVLPLLAVAALDLTGKRTLATRNLIGLAPACAVLAALGVQRLASRSAAAALGALALLGALAVPSLAALPGWSAKADWRGAALAVQRSGAEPLAFPPWVARCVEFHAGRPWNSVFGSRSAAEVRAWAAGRPRVLLVRQFDELEDGSHVAAELATRFGTPAVTTFRGGLRCELYGPP